MRLGITRPPAPNLALDVTRPKRVPSSGHTTAPPLAPECTDAVVWYIAGTDDDVVVVVVVVWYIDGTDGVPSRHLEGAKRGCEKFTTEDTAPRCTAGEQSTKPASIAPGPTLAKPTTATGDPAGAPASPGSADPGSRRRFTGMSRSASSVGPSPPSSTATTATSNGPRDTYTGAASRHVVFPGMPTRIDRTKGPLPSPPAAVDEG